MRRVLWVLVFMWAGCAVKPPPDPCADVDCGEGRCVVDQSAAVCVCEGERWVDGACVSPSPCEVVSCDALAGSSCVVHDGRARCECPGGALAHEGSCVAPNPCLPNPCTVVRRTTCEVVNGGVACRCDRGYAPEGNGCTAVPLWSCNTRHAAPDEDSAEPDECPLLASTLERNTTVARNLRPAGDHDWLQIAPWLNEVTRLTVTADEATLGLLVELYDAAGTTLLAADNHGATVATVAYTSRTGEPLMARVRSLGGGIGGYTVKYETLGVDDHPDRAEDADHLQLPVTVGGTALHARDLDVLWLEFPARREVSLRFESTGSRLELQRDGLTVRTLRDGDTLLATVAADESVLAVVIPENGLGTFTITTSLGDVDDHADDVSFATRISADNAWQTGETGWSSDIDSFVIAQLAGHRYVARWQSLSGSTLPGISVFEDNGAFIGTSGNGATDFAWLATSDRDAYVRLQNRNSGINTSRYQLAVDDLGLDDHSDEFTDATPLTFAQPGSGAITWAGDIDVFWFDATANHVVAVSVAQFAGEPAPGVTLQGPDGPIASALNDIFAITPQSGRHYVMVGPGSGLSRYMVTLRDLGVDDHGDTDATATPLVLDTVVTGSTQFINDRDVFSISVSAGVVYRLVYSHQSQSREVIVRQNGVVQNDVPLPIDGSFSPSVSGPVSITVSSPTPGPFQLQLVADRLDDVGNVPGNASSIAPDVVRSAAIDFGRDVDVFRISAEARRVYRVEATSTNPLLRVAQLAANGTLIRAPTTPSLSLSRDTAGDLFIAVSSQSRVPGPYQLLVTTLGLDDHAVGITGAVPLTLATNFTGHADFEWDADTTYFDAPAQRHLRATCTASQGGCTVTISDDAGWVQTSPLGGVSSLTFRVNVPTRVYATVTTELQGADWSVRIDDLGADDVGDTNAAATALPVDGVTRPFSLEVSDDVDVFRLTLSAGQIVWLTLNRFNLRVRTPTGATSELRQFRATVAGDYFVEVFVEAAVSGTYNLTAQLGTDDFPNTVALSSPLTSAVMVYGRRDYQNDIDAFSLQATAGQPVDIEMSEGCTLRLLSATGSGLVNTTEPLVWVPTTSGPLYVLIGPCDTPTYALYATF